MHFAHLGFNIQYFQDGIELETGFTNHAICVLFEPYILKYEKNHRINLRNAAAAHRVDEIILNEIVIFFQNKSLLKRFRKGMSRNLKFAKETV